MHACNASPTHISGDSAQQRNDQPAVLGARPHDGQQQQQLPSEHALCVGSGGAPAPGHRKPALVHFNRPVRPLDAQGVHGAAAAVAAAAGKDMVDHPVLHLAHFARDGAAGADGKPRAAAAAAAIATVKDPLPLLQRVERVPRSEPAIAPEVAQVGCLGAPVGVRGPIGRHIACLSGGEEGVSG